MLLREHERLPRLAPSTRFRLRRRIVDCASRQADDAQHGPSAQQGPGAQHGSGADVQAGSAGGEHLAQRKNPVRRRSLARRSVRIAGLFTAISLGFLVLLGGVLAIRLAMGPIAIEGLSQRVAAAMNRQIGAGWKASISGAAINHAGMNPALTLKGVAIVGPDGQNAIAAPEATVAVDPWGLVWGQFRPRSIEFRGLALRLMVDPDGSISFRAGADNDAAAAGNGPPPAPGNAAHTGLETPGAQLTDTIARGVASAIDLLTESDGLLGGIDTASITGARVILAGSDGVERFRFSDANLLFSRPKDNLRNFSFELTGGKGRWRLEGAVSGRAGEKRVANVTFSDVPVSDLQAFGRSEKELWTDMPLSGAIIGAIRPDGVLADLSATVRGATAIIHTDDPDMPQFTMDTVDLEANWNAADHKFSIPRLHAAWDGYHVTASGALERGEGADAWRLQLESTDALAAPFAPGDKPLPINRVTARLAGGRDGGTRIDQLDVAAGGGTVTLTGQLGGAATGDGVDLHVVGRNAEARAALALWPSFSAKGVRDYMGQTFVAGLVDSFDVRVRMTREDILKARKQQPMRAEELAVNVAVSNAIWRATPETPPVHASASASVTGVEARIGLKDGFMAPDNGPTLPIASGEVLIHSARRPIPSADITFRIGGDLPTLMRVMDRAKLGEAPIDPAAVSGQALLDVGLQIPLKPSAQPVEIQPNISGSLRDVAISKVAGDYNLEGGAFQVTVDAAQSQLKGEGRIATVPVNIDLRQPRTNRAGGEIRVAATLDEATRSRLNVNLGTGLSGPVTVNAVLPLERAGPGQDDKDGPPQQIDVDLTRARITELLPGWSKPAGRAGKLTFQLEALRAGWRASELTLDAGNVSGSKGVAEFDAKGGFQRLRFGGFRMSPSDNMRVDVDRVEDVYRVTVRGQLIDARPMLRAIITDDGGKGRAGQKTASGTGAAGSAAPKIDLDLSSAILAGFNGEALTNATLKASSRNGEVRQARMDGRFGQATASLRLTPDAGAVERLEITASNAGALLRFADLYKRMYGGDLVISAQLGPKSQSGNIDVARFSLRDEPALGRIAAAQPASGSNRLNVSEVPFQRLQGQFDRSAGRVQLQDGIIWGPQVGIKLDGTVDFARDRTDLTGTFIPAYALNNAFARIPLVGPLIGGGANEGMFAVSFRITGPASAPTLTVNPLTAVAPGILRKFVEVFTPDGSGQRQQPQPTPPGRIP